MQEEDRLRPEEHTIDVKSARSRVASIRKDREIPPLKAIEDLTACINVLSRRPIEYALAEAYAVRGTAYARGMEDHASSFRDWRRALGIITSRKDAPKRFLNLAGYIRVQMAFHSEGASRIRYFNQAMRDYRAADNPRAVAFVLVERGMERKRRGEYRESLKDLEDGLAIARWKRMEARRQVMGFIRETRQMASNANIE